MPTRKKANPKKPKELFFATTQQKRIDMLKKIVLKGEQKKVLFLPPINPIQIKGVAGSGKTTVALYRAKYLLETQNTLFQEAKIVIFTFNKTLAAYIRAISPYINGGYQKESDEINPKTPDGLNVQIINFHSWAFRFANLTFGHTVAFAPTQTPSSNTMPPSIRSKDSFL